MPEQPLLPPPSLLTSPWAGPGAGPGPVPAPFSAPSTAPATVIPAAHLQFAARQSGVAAVGGLREEGRLEGVRGRRAGPIWRGPLLS